MRTLAAIPCYNEEVTIGSVILQAKGLVDKVIIIDDGSEDQTGRVAEKAGAIVLRHDENRGKGQALNTAFEYALENGFDAVVTMDGDGQHDPRQIPEILEPILRGEADLVIGSRYLDSTYTKIPLYRRLGLSILNLTTNFTSRTPVSDSQSGFRALNREALKTLDFGNSKEFNVENDMIFQASENNLKIQESSIDVRYDVPKGHSNQSFDHGTGVLGRIVTLIGYKRPLLLFGSLALVSFAVCAVFGYMGLDFYYRTGNPYTLKLVISGFFAILGIQLAVAGLTLNVLSEFAKE